MQLRCTALPLPRARRSLRDPRKERWSLKLTRHNGRAGKHGTYNTKHNDRSFEIANSEHIDPERVQQNIYWDCYNGIRSALQPKSEESLADTFEEVEKLYYKLHYTNFTEKQNERNAKIRHTERNRSPEDLLTSKKTCPKKASISLERWRATLRPKSFFKSPQNLWMSSMSVSANTFTFWIGPCIWMKVRRTSTNAMCLTVKISMERLLRSRKRHWKHWVLNCQNQTSPLVATTIVRSHLMQPAARCYSRLPNATAWNWTKCRNTADGLIWKSGTISWQSKKNNLLNRKKPYRNRPLSLKI